jgi:hypothetical protein
MVHLQLPVRGAEMTSEFLAYHLNILGVSLLPLRLKRVWQKTLGVQKGLAHVQKTRALVVALDFDESLTPLLIVLVYRSCLYRKLGRMERPNFLFLFKPRFTIKRLFIY